MLTLLTASGRVSLASIFIHAKPIDGFLFIEEVGPAHPASSGFPENIQRLLVLPLHRSATTCWSTLVWVSAEQARGVAAQILIGNGLQRHHVEIVAHAVPGDHGTGQLWPAQYR